VFSKHAWDSCSEIFAKAKELPFNTELKNGTLPLEKFKFYMEQDSLYLIDFARVLAFAAGKSENPEHVIELIKFAEGAIVCERDLHNYYFETFKVNFKNLKKSKSCSAYTDYLLQTAKNASMVEILAAVLPCFWYYRDLGIYIYKNSHKDNPYIKWIETYSSHDFSNATDKMIKLVDNVSAHIDPSSSLGKRILFLFKRSAELEVDFWNDAYKNHKEVL